MRPNHPGMCKEISNLVAVSATEFDRYNRNVKLAKVSNPSVTIEPQTTSFPTSSSISSTPLANWKPFIHPEGALYFFDARRRVLTDAYLHDQDALIRIDLYISSIFAYMQKYTIQRVSSAVLVLELRHSGNCGYYFVDHSDQCIFWLDTFDASDMVTDARVTITLEHLDFEMKSQYWYHNHLFPCNHELSPTVIKIVKEWLVLSIGDVLTSEDHSSPYELKELESLLSVVNTIEGISHRDVNDVEDNGPKGSGGAWLIYRLMFTLYHERFRNLHGHQSARLESTQSLHPDRERTYLMTIFSPLFLYGPEVHYKKLQHILVDCYVKRTSWTQLLKELTNEWNYLTLFATVLLNANIAFLAIQSVDTGPAHGPRSHAQRASYISAVASLGSVVISLLFVRQHGTIITMKFLANRGESSMGLETLALLYSLPYTLLLWATVSFIAAFAIYCFTSGDAPTIVLMSVACLMFVLLVLWGVSLYFEKEPYYYPWICRKWINLESLIVSLIPAKECKQAPRDSTV
ncbi:hypothetical protein BDQ12DRAFT_616975 [Crucibulum laeve]|uniref:WW domain-containing protein n=1 Tax=Crucibulum laeve TaxID=68775 RepID=A0A5C3LUS9_9AGAR|nr:hypothetical protein BDQ12DRAFT_616975 [Crucibulum laeve]